MHSHVVRWSLATFVGLMMIIVAFTPGLARASAPTCSAAGDTGLTAAHVATANEHISGTIDATGCDVGIFVGPGTTGVVIVRATVSGANDHGIFAQDTWGLTIVHSSIIGNGVKPHTCDIPGIHPCILEDKALEFAGVSYSVIAHDVVSNNGFGGIGIADDGPQADPGAYNPGSANAAIGNVITHNVAEGNLNDCSIVVAAYNAGVGAANNVVTHNTILGDQPPFRRGASDGQIVVATDGPNTYVNDTVIDHNVIIGSELPGIVVHANVFGDIISGTVIAHNTISKNGYYPPFFATVNTPNETPTGIALVAEGPPVNEATPVLTNTLIFADKVTADVSGLWLCYSTGTVIKHFQTDAPNPIATCSAGGS
jgi:hypothetical protein